MSSYISYDKSQWKPSASNRKMKYNPARGSQRHYENGQKRTRSAFLSSQSGASGVTTIPQCGSEKRKLSRNEPRYQQYIPNIYDKHSKTIRNFGKDFYTAAVSFDYPCTPGIEFASPAPKNKISYDSSNKPNSRQYSEGKFNSMASKQFKVNKHRLDIAKQVGRGRRSWD